jgi:hypothetical protein
MPSLASRVKYVPAEDGLFYCQEPGCEHREGYKLPQHLGLHRFHHHGIKGSSRNPNGTSRTTGPKGSGPKPLGRPPKNRPVMLSAEEICSAALEAVAPNGSIPISALPAYLTWVEQTRAFFGYLLG